MKPNRKENNEENKERWAFIEKASEEVNNWSDSKKAEVSPSKFQNQQDIKTMPSDLSKKVVFD